MIIPEHAIELIARLNFPTRLLQVPDFTQAAVAEVVLYNVWTVEAPMLNFVSSVLSPKRVDDFDTSVPKFLFVILQSFLKNFFPYINRIKSKLI